jgi:hypothetical protein
MKTNTFATLAAIASVLALVAASDAAHAAAKNKKKKPAAPEPAAAATPAPPPPPAPAPAPAAAAASAPAAAAASAPAAAAAAAPATAATPAPAASEPDKVTKPEPVEPSRGGLLAGAKLGGVFSFGGLSPFVNVGIELGYVFPWMNRSFAAALDLDYTAPRKEGTSPDPRLPAGTYSWHLTEQQLAVMPVFLYRMTFLRGPATPYVGIGPRFYFVRGTVRGDMAGAPIEETKEQGTKIGFGLPLGIEFRLGPGALVGEALLQYAGVDHRVTGDSNLGAANVTVGYRLLL